MNTERKWLLTITEAERQMLIQAIQSPGPPTIELIELAGRLHALAEDDDSRE